MEEQRQIRPRRRGLVAAILGAAALAIALPAGGALAGGGSSESSSSDGAAGAVPVQNEQDREKRDGDCPFERDRQGDDSPGSESSIEL
jgi:hypothetical protein